MSDTLRIASGEMTEPRALVPNITPTNPAVEALLHDLQKNSDPVPERTVVRWTSVQPVNGVEFHYSAVFAGGAWYTTVPRDNDNVQKIMTHDDFLGYLNKRKKNLKNIEVAVVFNSLSW